MNVPQTHEDGNHQPAIVEIVVFVHFFYHDDMPVSWGHDNAVSILTAKVADRTPIEVKHYTIDGTEYNCKNPKRYL